MLLEEVPLLLWLSFCNEFASARCLALWCWLPESTRGWVGAPTLRLSPATPAWGHLVSPPGTCARVAGQWQSPRGTGTSPRGLLTARRRQMGDNGTRSALGGDNLGDDSERVWGNPSFQALLGRGRPLVKRQIRVSSYNNNPSQISKSRNQITTKKGTNTKSIEFQSHF